MLLLLARLALRCCPPGPGEFSPRLTRKTRAIQETPLSSGVYERDGASSAGFNPPVLTNRGSCPGAESGTCSGRHRGLNAHSPPPLRVEPGHSTPQTADTRPRRLRQQLARTWTLQGASARPSLLVAIYSSLAQNVTARTAGPGSPQLAPRPRSEASLPQGKTAARLKAAGRDNKENSCLQPPASGRFI